MQINIVWYIICMKHQSLFSGKNNKNIQNIVWWNLYNDAYLIMQYFFSLIFFIKTFVVGHIHLNYLDLLRQFKWIPITYMLL